MATARWKQAIKHPGEVPYFLWKRAFALIGHDHYKRFIMLAAPRTGSTLLLSYLNSHRKVYAVGEIFQRLNGEDFRKILKRVFCKQPPNIKAVGFKIFYGHPYDDKKSGVWNELLGLQQLHIIHIKRRNFLRTLLSRKISKKTNVWHKLEGDPSLSVESRRVEFTYEELETKFERLRNLESEFDGKFRSHSMLTVYYEDLASRPNVEFGRITNFLELPFQRPKSKHTRMNPEKLSTLVADFEYLKKRFSGTEWAQFFEEEASASVEL